MLGRCKRAYLPGIVRRLGIVPQAVIGPGISELQMILISAAQFLRRMFKFYP